MDSQDKKRENIELKIKNPNDIKIDIKDLEIIEDDNDAGEFLEDAFDEDNSIDKNNNVSNESSTENVSKSGEIDNNKPIDDSVGENNNTVNKDSNINNDNNSSSNNSSNTENNTVSNDSNSLNENNSDSSNDINKENDVNNSNDIPDPDKIGDGDNEKKDDNQKLDDKDKENKDDNQKSDDKDNQNKDDNKKPDDKDNENKDDNKKPDDKNKKNDNKKLDDKDKKDDDKKSDDKDKKNDDKKSDNKENKDNNKRPDDKDNKKNDNKSAADKKRDEAKQKQEDSRNKNNNHNNSSLKDRAKNGVKNASRNMANKAKDNLNPLANTGIGKAANNAKNVVEGIEKTVEKTKKTVTFIVKHWHLCLGILIGAGFLFFLLLLIPILFEPGGKGSVDHPYYSVNYNEKDRETLEKIKNEGFASSGDANTKAFAMATIVYPFFQEIHEGNVKIYFDDYEECTYGSESCELEINDSNEETSDDDDISAEEDSIKYDKYLRPLYKKRFRKRLNELIENISGKSEEEQNQYIIDKVFNTGGIYIFEESSFITGFNGYKNMFKKMKPDMKKQDLEKDIIRNLRNISRLFLPYISENFDCISSSQSLSYSSAGDIIKGTPYVVLKDTGASSYSALKAAPALYGTDTNPLTLPRYILGVVYAEIGDDIVLKEYAKAQMIAAKSFLLGRTQKGGPTGSGIVGMGFKPDYVDGKTIFYIRGFSIDQGFCDIYEGCGANHPTFNTCWATNHKEGRCNGKKALSKEKIAYLEELWEETVDQYIYNQEDDVFAGEFFQSFGLSNDCVPGVCLTQNDAKKAAQSGKDYLYILKNVAYTDSKFVMYNEKEQSLYAVSADCTPRQEGGCGIDDNDFVYYNQNDYTQTFCDTDKSIKEVGCGVTAMSMVISNLTNSNVDPMNTSEEAYAANQGYCDKNGTYEQYFDYSAKLHGLTIKQFSQNESGINEVMDTLNNGGLVIAHVGDSSEFTDGNHYIVLRKAIGDSQVMVADPDHHENFNNIYNIKDFVDKSWLVGGGWYGFTSSKSKDIKDKYCSEPIINAGSGEATGYLSDPLVSNGTTNKYSGIDFPCYSGKCKYDATGKVTNPHSGIDIATGSANRGKPVYAMDGGTVIFAGTYKGRCYPNCVNDQSYGLGIKVDSGNGYEIWYLHFSGRPDNIKNGTKISKGQLIGYVGNTGYTAGTSGVHLHISLINKSRFHTNYPGCAGKNPYKCSRGYSNRAFLNPALYINTGKSYVGK